MKVSCDKKQKKTATVRAGIRSSAKLCGKTVRQFIKMKIVSCPQKKCSSLKRECSGFPMMDVEMMPSCFPIRRSDLHTCTNQSVRRSGLILWQICKISLYRLQKELRSSQRRADWKGKPRRRTDRERGVFSDTGDQSGTGSTHQDNYKEGRQQDTRGWTWQNVSHFEIKVREGGSDIWLSCVSLNWKGEIAFLPEQLFNISTVLIMDFLTAVISTCHSRKSTGGTNNIN